MYNWTFPHLEKFNGKINLFSIIIDFNLIFWQNVFTWAITEKKKHLSIRWKVHVFDDVQEILFIVSRTRTNFARFWRHGEFLLNPSKTSCKHNYPFEVNLDYFYICFIQCKWNSNRNNHFVFILIVRRISDH